MWCDAHSKLTTKLLWPVILCPVLMWNRDEVQELQAVGLTVLDVDQLSL